jgi:transcriptional regulator with XRE-family HTH domain
MPVMRLQDYMKAAGLRDEDLAGMLGIHPRSLQKLRDRRRLPRLGLAWRIHCVTKGAVGLPDWFDDDGSCSAAA